MRITMKWNYLALFLLCSVNLHAMETDTEQEEASKNKTLEEKYSEFAMDRFFDRRVDPRATHPRERELMQFLIKTKVSRLGIMLRRSLEINMCREHDILQTSAIYGQLKQKAITNVLTDKKKLTPIQILAENIKHTEKVLNLDYLYKETCQLLEDTRTLDIILLKATIERDNMYDRTEMYNFQNRLAHSNWPPQHHKKVFSPHSGYTVICDALEKRKANHIDLLDESKWREEWETKS